MLDEWLWSGFIADSLGPVTMPAGKEAQGEGGDSLWATTQEEEDQNEQQGAMGSVWY